MTMIRQLPSLLVLLLVMQSCALRGPLRPGAVNATDQHLFDTMADVQRFIELQRPKVEAMNDPALKAKVLEPFNRVVRAYNTAEPVYQEYAAALRRGENPSGAVVAGLITAAFKAYSEYRLGGAQQ